MKILSQLKSGDAPSPVLRSKPLSAYQESLASVQAEIDIAHRLSDLEFRTQDCIITTSRRYGTTIPIWGHLWSWLTSFFRDDNQQNLKALLSVQNEKYQHELDESFNSPTADKVNKLVLYHRAFSNCLRSTQKFTSGEPLFKAPESLGDRIVRELNAIPQDKLETACGLDDQITHKLKRLQAVVKAIEQSQFKNDYNQLIKSFRDKYEGLLLKRPIFEKSQSILENMDPSYKDCSNPLQKLAEELGSPPVHPRAKSIWNDRLLAICNEMLKIEDLKKAFPQTYEMCRLHVARFSKLPSDAIRLITQKLSIEARGALAQTCTAMSRMVHTCKPGPSFDDYLKKFKSFSFERRKEILKNILEAHCTQFSPVLIDALINSHLENTPIDYLYEEAAALLKTGKMKSLTLSGNFFGRTSTIRGYEQCENVIDRLSRLPEIKNLTSLHFRFVPENSVIANVIQSFIEKSVNLTHLSLSLTSTNDSLDNYLPPNLTSRSALTSVELGHCQLTPTALQRLPETLEALKIDYVGIVDQTCFDLLLRLVALKELTLNIYTPHEGLEIRLPPDLRYLKLSKLHSYGDRVFVNIRNLDDISKLKHLETLIFENFDHCSEDTIIASLPSSITSLEIEGTNIISDEFFAKLGPFTHLRSLIICGNHPKLKGHSIESIPMHIRNIELPKTKMSDQGLRAYIQRCPSQFQNFYLSSDHVDGSFLKDAPNWIQTLQLQGTNPFSVQTLSYLSSQTNLTKISLLPSIGIYSKEHLEQLPLSITSLFFKNREYERVPLAGFKRMINLRELHLEGSLNPSEIDNLPISIEKLTLFINACDIDESVRQLGRLDHLIELDLSSPINGTTLSSLPQNLQKLTLFSKYLDDAGLSNLQSLNLKHLVLTYAQNITDKTFVNLPTTLEVLELRSCANIDSQCIKALKNQRPNLKIVLDPPNVSPY